jgi:exodeoxyribonuclease VII small subunit
MKDYEEKLKQAKELLEKLNNPEITLYEGMEIYKKGIKIIEEAEEILQKAKLEYEEIKN